MGSRTLILGGGFGGISTATELRSRLPADHEIVLVDRRDSFVMGLRKLWVLVGTETLDAGRRSLAALARLGVRVEHAEITAIDPERRTVETDAGILEADRLVIALGAESRPDLVPGLAQHAFDLYDADSVSRVASRLAGLKSGSVVVAVAGLPYRCPPAPYEAVMLLDDFFRKAGVREAVRLGFVTMQPMLLPNAGAEGAMWVGEQLALRGIEVAVGTKVTAVTTDRLIFEDGEVRCDVALIAPPHRPPKVITDSPLAGSGGWVEVDRSTLQTPFPGVFAIGDVTHIPLANDAALPKAGLFAEAHGQRVAAAIVSEVTGTGAPSPFEGVGACFLEMGDGQATLVQGDFFALPAPNVRIGEPSSDHLAAKHRFESDRLARWFGDVGA